MASWDGIDWGDRRRLGLAAVTLAALVVAGIAWLITSRPRVTVVAPVRGDAAEVVYATGVVEPVDWAKVSAVQRRRIAEICSCEGKAVKRGEVLGRLEDGPERSLLKELEARRQRIQEDLSRLEGLLERSITSRVTYDEKFTQLREQDARIAAQKDRIDELVLRAPMDGVVLRKDGSVGEMAGTGVNDVLLWIGRPKPLHVVAEVNEEDIARVREGLTVLLRHEGHAGAPLQAHVHRITPKGDPASKTFRAYFALPDDTPLRIGMSVEANIVAHTARGVMLIPTDAVVDGKAQVVRDGRVRSVPVEVGIRGTRAVEVKSGLDMKALVVTPADRGLTDGTRVRTQPRGGD